MKTLVRIVVPLLILALGAAGMMALVKARPTPAKKPIEQQGTPVLVQTARVADHPLTIHAQGTVVPAQQIVVQAEVSGRVIWQHKELIPGGRFKQGELLLKLDPRDYVLRAEQQSANVDRAQLELRLESSRKVIAEQEWNIIGEDQNATEEGRLLALRDPQLKTAQANLEAARSAQAQAKLAVGKTAIVAPFNALVQSENVDVGQLVGPQAPLATLVGTDEFWVQVSVPMDKLGRFSIPGVNAAKGEGSSVEIVQDVGEQRIARTGQVIRLLGDLDPVGRMARVLVAIPDPLGLKASKPTPTEGEPAAVSLPLLVGAYVEVKMSGRGVQRAVELPRSALREGNKVYLYGSDDRLVIRTVEVVWRRSDTVLIGKGIEDGAPVITSRIGTPVDGMLLKRAEPPPEQASATPAGAANEQAHAKPAVTSETN